MALYPISIPAELSYTRNPINIKVHLQPDSEYIDVYALCTIYSSLTDVVTVLFARPDNDYNVEFDISSVLDSINEFSIPNISETDEKITDFVKPYWCQIQQFNDGLAYDTLNIGRSGDTITLFSCKGGLSQEKISTDIFNLMTTNKMFLTWLTKESIIKEQKTYLYYLAQTTENIIAKAKIYYSDGTNSIVTLKDFGSVEKFNLLKIATGFNHRGLEFIQTGKTAIFYDVWLENDTAILRAGNFRYKILTDYIPYKKYICYANSLGGFDFLLIKGNINKKINSQSNEVEKYNSSGKQNISFNHTFYNSFKLSTGHISKTRFDALTDILTSSNRYEIIDAELRQIEIVKPKWDYNEIDNIFALELDCNYTFKNKNFTPDVIS